MLTLKTKNLKVILLNCIIPLFLGGMTYILYRETTIYMFEWSKMIGIYQFILDMRLYFNNFISPPDWFIYSLPNGLWVYSFIYSISLIWMHEKNIIRYFWITLVLILAIGSEIGQGIGFIPGTFDYMDLGISIFFGIIPFLKL